MKYIFYIFLFITVTSQAQTISGIVMDGEFNEPLPFANILVKGTTKGATSDIDGKFQIKIEPGTYTLAFSFVGYSSKEISNVEVNAGKDTFIEVTLSPASNQLEAVVIKTTARQNSEASVLNLQKKSISLVDGLSVQSIRKAGDSDIAGAVKRVPGISVQGGKYVYVRGLGDRYSKTLLNGSEVSGLDPDRNTLPMDLFPTNIIENILVVKSASADLSADFTGGTVDIKIRDFSYSPTYSVNMSTGYNPDMHFNDNYISDIRSSTDWLGKDDGYREIPFTDDVTIIANSRRPESAELPGLIRQFNPQMAPIQDRSSMNSKFSFSASNGYKFENGSSIGYVFSLGYKREIEYYDNLINQTVFRTQGTYDQNSYQVSQLGKDNVYLSGLAGLSFKNSNNKLSINYIKLINGESASQNFAYEEFIENVQNTVGSNMNYTERELTIIPFNYNLTMFDGKADLNVDLSSSTSRLHDKDFKRTTFLIRGTAEEPLYIVRNTSGFPNRLWRYLDEETLVGKLQLGIKMDNSLFTGKIKVGASRISKDRDFSTFNYIFDTSNLPGSVSPDADANDILTDENIWTPENNSGFYLRSNHERTARYSSRTLTNGGFVSSEMKFSDFFKAIVGVRYEQFDLFYTGEDFDGNIYDDEKFIDVSDFFPSANLIFSLDDQTNIRASYSKTTARPTFKEASTAYLQNLIENTTFLGNPDLKPSYIDNLDLRYEKFGEGNSMLAFSLFYKQFKDPIEIANFDSNSPQDFIAVNNDQAKVYGAEFEIRKNILEYDNSVLSFSSNISYIIARQFLTEEEFEARKSINDALGIETDNYRDLQGQSPYLINAGLVYARPEDRFQAGVFYNVQGPTLEIVGSGGQIPDIFIQPFHNLDMNLSKVFGKPKFEKTVSLKVKNMLNSVRESLYQQDGMQDFIFRRFSPGLEFTLGLGLRF